MTQPTDVIRAAGGVVRRLDPDGTPRVLLIHRARYNDWTFPKGKCEPDESEADAAVREVAEETGVVARREADLGRIEYELDGRAKTVRFWLMGFHADLGTRDGEADDLCWCTLDEARALLTYPHEVPLLDAIDPMTRPGRVWLVRHGKAGSRSRYSGDDTTRPLTANGQLQAQALAAHLGHKPISRIVSSPYLRCVQTVAPLADALGLSIELDERLSEIGTAEAIWPWCTQPEPVVVCTHGNILGDAMEMLAARGVIDERDAVMPQKGSTWFLSTIGGEIVRARYAAPDPDAGASGR